MSKSIAEAAGLSKPAYKHKPGRTYDELKALFAKQDEDKAAALTQRALEKRLKQELKEADKRLKAQAKKELKDQKQHRKNVKKAFKVFLVTDAKWDREINKKVAALRDQGIRWPSNVMPCIFGDKEGHECTTRAVIDSKYPFCRKHQEGGPFDTCCSVADCEYAIASHLLDDGHDEYCEVHLHLWAAKREHKVSAPIQAPAPVIILPDIVAEALARAPKFAPPACVLPQVAPSPVALSEHAIEHAWSAFVNASASVAMEESEDEIINIVD